MQMRPMKTSSKSVVNRWLTARLFHSDPLPLKVTPSSSVWAVFAIRPVRPSTAQWSPRECDGRPTTDVAQTSTTSLPFNEQKLSAEFARVSQGESVAPRSIVLQYLRHKYDSCGDVNRFENLIKSLFPRRRMDVFDSNEFAIILLRLAQS